jgi:hypothetical protein
VPTLAQVIRSVSPSSQDERSSPASRMSVSRTVSVNNEDPDAPAAGRPSNWNANKTTYAGRRSRRNSITEADSQLTVENFGGSQDNINKLVIEKNPDKQPAILTDATSSPVRYLRRGSSQEPSDFYQNNAPSPAPPQNSGPESSSRSSSEPRYSKITDRDEASQRLSGVAGVGANGDVAFYGRKKFNHTLNPDYEEQVHMTQQQQDRDFELDRDNEQQTRRPMQSGSQGNVTVYVMGQGGESSTGFDGTFELNIIHYTN